MTNADIAFLAGEFLGELAQLGHGAQCETENYTNSAPCDCGLETVKIKATAVISEFMERLNG